MMTDIYDLLVHIFEYINCLTPAMFVSHSWHTAALHFVGRKGVRKRGILRFCARWGHMELFDWARANGAPAEIRLYRKAIKSGQPSVLKKIHIAFPTPYGQYHITEAVSTGHIEVLEEIIYRARGSYRISSHEILLAIESRQISMVRYCYNHQDRYDQRKDHRETFLMAASLTCDNDIIDLVIRNSDPPITADIFRSCGFYVDDDGAE